MSYPQYKAALCQYGLRSAFSATVCTKSINIQQHGASMTRTTKPANICSIPDMTHDISNVNIPKQLNKPNRIATGKTT